jgi:hypothetical protein
VKCYKGFDKDLKCRGFQYEIGKEYEENTADICHKGFHACENPMDVFGYYNPADSRYCEVDLDTNEQTEEDSKRVGKKIKIETEIGLSGLIRAGVKFILEKVDFKSAKESNTGEQSAATNTGARSAAMSAGRQSAATNTGRQSAATSTGEQSAATNTGARSAAMNTGEQSAATNTGARSAATNTGNQSAATSTGNQSAATNTGYQSAATNTGYQSAATNTGYQSAATNTGNWSAATNTGNRSAATNTGNWSAATVGGAESIAVVTGYGSKAKGAVGCWLVLTERDEKMHILGVQAVCVDGETIKADTFYMLKNGAIIEVDE